MWRRPIALTEPTSGARSTRNAARDRNARSAPLTLPGAQDDGQLVEVAAHRGHQVRDNGGQRVPGR
jgi:hypothetical protein